MSSGQRLEFQYSELKLKLTVPKLNYEVIKAIVLPHISARGEFFVWHSNLGVQFLTPQSGLCLRAGPNDAKWTERCAT